MFNWDTFRAVGPDTLHFESGEVSGTAYELELTSGGTILVWRADDGRQYFCHGLTFGGKEAPGGVISPYGGHVPTILSSYYVPVPEAEANPGDILVWRGIDANDIVHSAILTDAIKAEGQQPLDYSARLQTKNGIKPETNMTLRQIVEGFYGESYNVYRRK